MSEVKYPEIIIQLVGLDGNAFSILARCRAAMKRAHCSETEINEFTKEVEKYGADIEKWAVNAYDWGDDITRNFNSRSGEDIQDELDDIMNNSAIVPNNPYEGMTAEEMLEEINRLNGTADDIKSNTASGTDMSEILRLLRDISEREAINRFTTAEIKLDIGGITNQVNSKEDIGSLAEYIAGQLEEAVYISAAKLNNA